MAIPQNLPIINSIEALHGINGSPSKRTTVKIRSTLDTHTRRFIERCPFLVLATGTGDAADASPRGDEPGFIKVLDDTTLLIPERPGNRIADSMTNIISHPALGMLMMIPGMNETLRINGNGYVTDAMEFREPLAHAGKVPRLAIVVDVMEVYFHCPKAYIRSRLWDSSAQMPRGELPTLGKMLLEQINDGKASKEEIDGLDAALETDSKENLY